MKKKMFSCCCKCEWEFIISLSAGWTPDNNPSLSDHHQCHHEQTGRARGAAVLGDSAQSMLFSDTMRLCGALYLLLIIIMTWLKLSGSPWKGLQSLVAFGSQLLQYCLGRNHRRKFSQLGKKKQFSYFCL